MLMHRAYCIAHAAIIKFTKNVWIDLVSVD